MKEGWTGRRERKREKTANFKQATCRLHPPPRANRVAWRRENSIVFAFHVSKTTEEKVPGVADHLELTGGEGGWGVNLYECILKSVFVNTEYQQYS